MLALALPKNVYSQDESPATQPLYPLPGGHGGSDGTHVPVGLCYGPHDDSKYDPRIAKALAVIRSTLDQAVFLYPDIHSHYDAHDDEILVEILGGPLSDSMQCIREYPECDSDLDGVDGEEDDNE